MPRWPVDATVLLRVVDEMFRAFSFVGIAGGVVLTLSALGGHPSDRESGLLAGSGLLGGSAVAALLAEAGTRQKFKGITDVEKEIQRQRTLAKERLDAINRAKQESENQLLVSAKKLKRLEDAVADKSKEKGVLENSAEKLRKKIKELNQDVEDIFDIDDAGFAARRYPGLDSRRLANLLKQNRENQKQEGKLLLDECKQSSLTVGGSNAQGKAYVRQTLKALLRGFNGECDAAISTLKHSNDSTVPQTYYLIKNLQ